MTEVELKNRTKLFALNGIEIGRRVSSAGAIGQILGKQFVRCSTSVGANYRSACRAKSRPDMISKLQIVEEELDESLYWADLMIESKVAERSELEAFIIEGEELLRIVVASIKTLRSNQASAKSKI